MKRWIAAFSLIAIFGVASIAAAKGPEVDLVDNRLSINAEGVSIGRLLQLVDMATGMKSKVPPEIANRNISVKFSDLTLTDGFRKMFQGQPLDYVVVEGKSIIITASSQNGGGAESTPFTQQPSIQPTEQPFVQGFPEAAPVAPPIQQQQQQQPPTVQTPFGPIANPRAAQQQPNAPINTPGQQNSLFPGNPTPFGQPTAQPGQQQVNPNGLQGTSPFGTPNQGFSTPFGQPSAPANNQNNPNNNNGLFGNPQVFGQQRQQ